MLCVYVGGGGECSKGKMRGLQSPPPIKAKQNMKWVPCFTHVLYYVIFVVVGHFALELFGAGEGGGRGLGGLVYISSNNQNYSQ